MFFRWWLAATEICMRGRSTISAWPTSGWTWEDWIQACGAVGQTPWSEYSGILRIILKTYQTRGMGLEIAFRCLVDIKLKSGPIPDVFNYFCKCVCKPDESHGFIWNDRRKASQALGHREQDSPWYEGSNAWEDQNVFNFPCPLPPIGYI